MSRQRYVVFRIPPATLNSDNQVREYLQPYHAGMEWTRNRAGALLLDDEHNARDLARSVNRAYSGMGGCAEVESVECYCLDHPTIQRTIVHPRCPVHGEADYEQRVADHNDAVLSGANYDRRYRYPK